MPRAPPLPADPLAEVEPQRDPPQDQQPPTAPTQEPQPPLSPLTASNPVPATHSSSPTPTALADPNSSSPPVTSIHITAQDFLAIMAAVCNFEATSQSFDATQAAMAKQMARIEAVLAHNTTILA